MKRQRILVTGGSGFVGGHVLKLAAKKYDVHSIYFKNPVEIPRITFHQMDISQPGSADEIFNVVDPEMILHIAAIANPDECEKDRALALKINHDFSVQLFELARENNRRFVFVSTDLVFDGTEKKYDESAAPNPINYYARLKVEVEKHILNSVSDAVIARLALVYGVGITKRNTFFETMLHKFQRQEKITIFYDQFRSPIWVVDAAKSLLELTENDFRGIIHLCPSTCLSRMEFALLMCDIFAFSEEQIESRSMDDFTFLARRPKAICLTSKLANRILKTKIHEPDEALRLIRKAMN